MPKHYFASHMLALPYIKAGNAHLIVGPDTHYQIAAPGVQDRAKGNIYFVRAQTAPPSPEYHYLGYLREEPTGDLTWHTSAKSATGPEADRAAARMVAVIAALNRGANHPYTLSHNGKCGRCRTALVLDADMGTGLHSNPDSCMPAPRRSRPPGWRPRTPGATPGASPSPSPSPSGTQPDLPMPDDAGDPGEPEPDAPPAPPRSSDIPLSPLTPRQAALAAALATLTRATGYTVSPNSHTLLEWFAREVAK